MIPTWGMAESVLLLVDPSRAVQEQAAETLSRTLSYRTPETEIRTLDVSTLTSGDLEDVDLVVTFGSKAANQLFSTDGSNVATLQCMVSRLEWGSLSERWPQRTIDALILDQPAERLIALIRFALPEVPGIGLVGEGETDPLTAPIIAEALDKGLKVSRQRADSAAQLHPNLQIALSDRAALVATGDPELYNARTARHILLTAYQLRAPVIGFSESFSRAGAVLSLYSTPAQVGQDCATRARQRLSGAPPAAQPHEPQHFSIASNRSVANALRLSLPSDQDILQYLSTPAVLR